LTVDDAALVGLDLDALMGWLDRERPGLREGPLTASLLTGGRSNLTYRLTDGASRWALRRPPLAHTLPTAHDMAREFRILHGLHGTEVPVAEPVVLCEDVEVIGAPFYVMEFVDGVVLDQPDALTGLTLAAAERSCDLLVDTLLALHALDAASVGLGELGRPEGFLDRQVRRWSKQWDASETEPRPDYHRLHDALAATVPPQSAPGIVHGDYRLTNVIYSADIGRIAAVVDWEMATLGDPLTDVGLLVVYQELSNAGGFVMPTLSVDAGFVTAADMVDRYAASSERDLSALSWYVAFGWFKLAVIAEGIHNRFLQGKTVGPGFDRFGPSVPVLIQSGLDALASSGGRNGLSPQ
jgi:aminoglycoside phosphotransferase (APT) family kinase protein